MRACEKMGTGSVTNHCGDTETDDAKVPVPIFSQALSDAAGELGSRGRGLGSRGRWRRINAL